MAPRELDRPPRLELLYARAVTLGLVGRGEQLPHEELTLAAAAIDRDHLAAYRRVCGFGDGDAVPATYGHVLAFPLALRLMTERTFPLPVLGLVHVANRVSQERPVAAGEAVSLRVRAQDLRRHDKGSMFDVVAEARVEGETAWTSVSTYLRRGDDSASSDGEERGGAGGDGEAGQHPERTFEVAGDVSRRYAAVSGDRNPHHLHPLLARAFGFPRLLAHGMWMKARCLAALEDRLPDRYTVDVTFRRPLLLPATVTLTTRESAGGWGFALRDAEQGKPHLTGTIASGGGG